MPRRGDVWCVRLSPTLGSEIVKSRPCLVLSANILNQRRRTVVVVPLSSSPKPSPPILVPVDCAGRRVVAVTDQIRAVAKERLNERLAEISRADLAAVEAAVRRILELG
jgi:mRNA interferase MazF